MLKKMNLLLLSLGLLFGSMVVNAGVLQPLQINLLSSPLPSQVETETDWNLVYQIKNPNTIPQYYLLSLFNIPQVNVAQNTCVVNNSTLLLPQGTCAFVAIFSSG